MSYDKCIGYTLNVLDKFIVTKMISRFLLAYLPLALIHLANLYCTPVKF